MRSQSPDKQSRARESEAAHLVFSDPGMGETTHVEMVIIPPIKIVNLLLYVIIVLPTLVILLR